MRLFLILIITTLFTACGGGGGGTSTTNSGNQNPPPPPDAKPGGFYTGSFISDVTGDAVRVDGLILETGEAMFLSDYGIYTAMFVTDEDAVDAEFEAFALWGTTWDGINSYLHGNIDATVSERAGINGTYTLGSDSGTFSLTYDANIYEHESSLSNLSGTWGYQVPATGYTTSTSIDADGNFFGQDNAGCTFQGTLSVVNGNYNAYRLSNMRVDCPEGSLTGGDGMAYLGLDSQDREGMAFGVQFTQKVAVIDAWLKL